ncbi:MAG: hypothetical protein WBD06_19825 [Acidobacteriaceae bacterium]
MTPDLDASKSNHRVARLNGGISFPRARGHAAALINPGVLAYLTELLIRGTFSPKWRSTMRASESLNWGDAGFLRQERTMENGRTMQLRGDSKKSNFFRDGKRTGEISAGLLLDFRLQMRCSGANESALMQTKQRKYRWAQTEPDF